jgi:hypothetical protein
MAEMQAEEARIKEIVAMDDARIKAELAAKEAEMYLSMRKEPRDEQELPNTYQPPDPLQVNLSTQIRDVQAQTDDPWEHRSEGMRCRTCMWYVAKKGGGLEIGRCRRHSPTMSGYPAVYPGDWCGDHKVNEAVLGTPTQGGWHNNEPAVLGHSDTERVA